jgi:glycosyltransferase involved in cell wall biosynthesis
MNQDEKISKIISSAAGEKRVALGHDWLTGMRGGERVLEFFCKAFPEAEISTLIYNQKAMSDCINAHKVNTSFLNKIPGIEKTYRNFLPFMPAAARSTKVNDADLLITTSHCVSKSFRKPKGCKHICVIFTPMRYAWTFFEEYFGKSKLKGMLIKPLLAWLRKWDKATAPRVDMYVAISKHVAKRIHDFYGMDCEIVYPAVDTYRCTPNPDLKPKGDYALIVSALVPYKRVDLAVRLFARKGWKLKVVGVGGGLKELQKLAEGSSVEILGSLPDEEVLELYRNCTMLLFPGEEDYGIVPLEAQACGRPVVAYGKGGALETVVDGVTGVFFNEQTEDALEEAVERCSKIDFDPAVIRAHAEKFGPEQFADGMARCIKKLLAE